MNRTGMISSHAWTIALLASTTWASTAGASLLLHIDPVHTTWYLSGSDTGTPGSTFGNMLWSASVPGHNVASGKATAGSPSTFAWSDPDFHPDDVALAAFTNELQLQLSIGPNWSAVFPRGTITADPSMISFYGSITAEGLSLVEASIGRTMAPSAAGFSPISIVRGETPAFPEPPGACLVGLGIAGLLLNRRGRGSWPSAAAQDESTART